MAPCAHPGPAKALLIVELRRRRMRQRSVGVYESTVSRVLPRAGLSRLSALDRVEPAVCDGHEAPGELQRIDNKKLGRIVRPSHRRDAVDGTDWERLFVADHARRACIAMLLEEAGAGHARAVGANQLVPAFAIGWHGVGGDAQVMELRARGAPAVLAHHPLELRAHQGWALADHRLEAGDVVRQAWHLIVDGLELRLHGVESQGGVDNASRQHQGASWQKKRLPRKHWQRPRSARDRAGPGRQVHGTLRTSRTSRRQSMRGALAALLTDRHVIVKAVQDFLHTARQQMFGTLVDLQHCGHVYALGTGCMWVARQSLL